MHTLSFGKHSTKSFFYAALALGAVGCAGDDLEAQALEDVASDDLAQQAPATPTTTPIKPNGNATYFKSVSAFGTGCLPGTWNTSVSEDGLVFTTVFSDYSMAVDESLSVSTKNCQLTIKLHSPPRTQVALADFSYSGLANLQAGVELRQTSNYFFQGTPVRAESARNTIMGPFDDAFVFQDSVKTADLAWSPCGVDRDLVASTTLRIRNANPRAAGTAAVAAADGRTGTSVTVPASKRGPLELIIKLQQRACR